MHRYLYSLMVFIIAVCSFNLHSQEDFFSYSERVKSNFSCFSGPFHDYDTWLSFIENGKNFDRDRFTSEIKKEDFERFKKVLDCYVFTYKVDGLLVEGVFIKRKIIKGQSGKLPVIIFNRGGNGDYGKLIFGGIYQNLFKLADNNFIVIASQYRGSTSWPTKIARNETLDEYGGQDVNDIVALTDVIRNIPSADSNRVGMFGVSRGGFMTFLAAERMPLVKSIVVKSPITDLVAIKKDRPEFDILYKKMIPAYDSSEHEIIERSPLLKESIINSDISVLLMHGASDERVSYFQSVDMFNRLKENGNYAELFLISNGDHSLINSRGLIDEKIIEWFKSRL